MRFYEEIPDDDNLVEWVREQKLFHVATAPLTGDGHVNVSPKGLDTFKIMNRKACWYLDLTGSGNETISHLYEPGNSRMTILFQAFDGPPRLLRLFGSGRVIEYGTPEFEQLLDVTEQRADDEFGFPAPQMLPGARAIIWLDITRVGTSCGYSVPFMKFEGHRQTLNDWARKREEQDEAVSLDDAPQALPPRKGLQYYWVSTNSWSVDGLPGMKRVAALATVDLMHETMKAAGLAPPALPAARRRVLAQGLVLWLLGVVMGVLLLATVQRGPRLLDLPGPLGRARHLLERGQ